MTHTPVYELAFYNELDKKNRKLKQEIKDREYIVENYQIEIFNLKSQVEEIGAIIHDIEREIAEKRNELLKLNEYARRTLGDIK